jgi:uncharacterized membrane protein
MTKDNKRIEIPAFLEQAIKLFQEHASFLIGISVTYVVLAIVPNLYEGFFAPADPSLGYSAFSLLLTLLQMVLTMGYIKVCLALIDQRPTHVTDLFSPWNGLLSYFLATMIYILVIVIGLAMLIFPGIYLAIRLQFYPYFIVEEDVTFWEALNKSYHLTEQWTWGLFIWGLVNMLINILGVLVFFVGVVVSYPITQLVNVMIFRGMQRGAEHLPNEVDLQRIAALHEPNEN